MLNREKDLQVQQKKVKEQYDVTIDILDSLSNKLLDFLQNGNSITITNDDYMKGYDSVVNSSDLCQSVQVIQQEVNPSMLKKPKTKQQQKKAKIQTQNLNTTDDLENDAKLYKWIKQKLDEFSQIFYEKLINQKQDNNAVLDIYIQYIEKYQLYLHWFQKLFHYLDRVSFGQIKTIELGYNELKTQILKKLQEPFLNQLISYFLLKQWNEEKFDETNFQKFIKFYQILSFKDQIKLQKLGDQYTFSGKFCKQNIQSQDQSQSQKLQAEKAEIYLQYFQPQLLSFTLAQLNQQISNLWINLPSAQYCQHALKFLDDEYYRINTFYPYSKEHLLQQIYEVIIVKQSDRLLNDEQNGLFAILNKDKQEELYDLFRLFSNVNDELENFGKIFSDWIQDKGQQINDFGRDKRNNPLLYIKKVIAFKDKIDHLMLKIFSNNIIIQKYLNLGFKQFINALSKAPLYLAIKCDYEFKKGVKGKSIYEIQQTFKQIRNILRYVNSRDEFIYEYSQFFGKRLISETSLSQEAEQLMLSELKLEWGQIFVTKIQQMFDDMEKSKSELKRFQQYTQQKKINVPIVLNLKILTQGCWPTFDVNHNGAIPLELEETFRYFNKFYLEKYNNTRGLNLVPNEGNSEIIANFKNKKYIFIITNAQLIFLFKFNNKSQYTFQELKIQTQLSESLLRNIIIGFNKLEIVTYPDQTPIESSTIISINSNFENQAKKLNCVKFQGKVRDSKQNESSKEIEQSRNLQIDSILVRIMKARRIVQINDILEESMKSIKLFQPTVQQIKLRIESLIQRNYMKRDDNNFQVLIYQP